MDEKRLGDIAAYLDRLKAEVASLGDSDFEWLKVRLENAADEAKFMIHMKFRTTTKERTPT